MTMVDDMCKKSHDYEKTFIYLCKRRIIYLFKVKIKQ